MLAEPRCFRRRCLHFRGVINDGDETTERVICEAFQDRIPDAIAYGTNDHTCPVKGDGGIRFQKATPEEWERVLELR